MTHRSDLPETFSPGDYFALSPGLTCDFVTCLTCGWSTRVAFGQSGNVDCRLLEKHLRRHGVRVILRAWSTFVEHGSRHVDRGTCHA